MVDKDRSILIQTHKALRQWIDELDKQTEKADKLLIKIERLLPDDYHDPRDKPYENLP